MTAGDQPLDPARLVGSWRIERDLTDLRTGNAGRFDGTLTVSPAAGGFAWYEHGVLVWGQHRGPAERHLRLEQRAGDWWVCFADGRPFHPWRSGEFVHPCADDLYRGRLSLDPAEPDLFELVWEVTGPAKRQRLVSRMRRQPLAASTTSTPSM